MGRPSKYNAAIAGEILQRISRGEPLTKICQDDHMPNPDTVFNWERIIDGFSEKVTRAREASADHYSHEIIEIAQENPQVEIPTKFGSYTATDAAGIQRNRLRIDTRIKLMQMLKRKSYGEKVEVSGDLKIKTIIVRPEEKREVPRPELKPDFEES